MSKALKSGGSGGGGSTVIAVSANGTTPTYAKLDEMEQTLLDACKSLAEVINAIAHLDAKVKAIGTKLGFESK